MTDKISTIILNVDLECCNCDKRTKKTLCKHQAKCIEIPKPPVEEEKPKPDPKPSEPVKVEQNVVVQVIQLGYQPPVWQPGTSCGCGCRCGGCRRGPSWAPAYKTCTFFSCSVMCNCRFH